MNCIEKLRLHHREVCEACMWNGKIIRFDELTEEAKYEYHYYDEEKDYLLYCKKCQVCWLIPSDPEDSKQEERHE